MKPFVTLIVASAALAASAGQTVGHASGQGGVKVSWEKISRKAKWVEATTSTPKFSGAGTLGTFATKTLKAAAKKDLDSFFRDFKPEELPPNPYGFEWDTAVSIAKPNLISTYAAVYSYAGGAHPNTNFVFYTFGTIDGKAKRLRFGDLMRTRMLPKTVVSDVVIPKLKGMNASAVTDGDMLEVPDECIDSFVITPSGFTWIFAAYEVGSYAEGPYTVKVSWDELREHLNPNGPLKGIMPAPKQR